MKKDFTDKIFWIFERDYGFDWFDRFVDKYLSWNFDPIEHWIETHITPKVKCFLHK